MNLTTITSTIGVLSSWYNKAVKFGQVVGENSLSDLTKETKVQPLVIVSKDCVGVDAMPDIIQGLLNYTIADYMQGVAIFGKIDDIKVRRALAAFNPARDGSSGALLAMVNLESLSAAPMAYSLPIGVAPTLEAKEPKDGDASGKKFNSKELQEEARNLSVGKMVDVEFVTAPVGGDGKPCTVTLPIQFRLLTSFANSSSVMNLLTSGKDDTGFWARFERARDGGISPFIDFLLAQDMIQEKRKVMYSEDGRMLQTVLNRAAANKRAAIATRTPSLQTLANTYIITEREAAELKAVFGNDLDRESVRETIFRNVYASTLVVVDRQWNLVTFWHRGMDSGVTLDFKQLKAAAQGKGPDLMDMLKSFNLGAPVF